MVEFPLARSSKRCQIQNRPLLPGERYYSVAIAGSNEETVGHVHHDQVVRFDIAATAWTGPPANAIGWWLNEMPREEQLRVRPAKPIELLDRLSALCEDPSQASLASLLATLLVRRRILIPNPAPTEACPEGFAEYIHRATNSHFSVPTTAPAIDNESALQMQLQQLLVIDVSTSDSTVSEVVP